MKVKTILLTLALGFLGAAVCRAEDPQMGTWKLNEAKSKIAAGSPKASTVVYVHSEWTGKFDGKDYPVTGDPGADARSYKKVDDHTLTFTNKKGAKVFTSGRVVVSADGKSRTVTLNGTDSKGKKYTTTAVYDKQ